MDNKDGDNKHDKGDNNEDEDKSDEDKSDEDKSDDESITYEFDTILESIRNNVKVDKLLKIKTFNNNINLCSLIMKLLNAEEMVFKKDCVIWYLIFLMK